MPEDSTTRDSLRGEYAKAGEAELFDQLKSQITTEAEAGFYRQAADRLGMSEGALRVAVHRRDSRRQGEIHLDSPPAGRPLRHGPQVDAEWKGDPRRRISQRGIGALELRRRAGQGLAALPLPRDSGLPLARWIEDGDRDSRTGTAASGWPSSTRPIRCTRPSVPPSQRNSTFVAVVATYDGSRIALYVDGELDASCPAWGKIQRNDSPVVIGDNAEQPKRYWTGWIDDVRIYSYALSEDEIVELLKAGQQSVTSSR